MGHYTHVTRVKASELLFIAGMLSGDAAGNVIGEGDFDMQTAQVFWNVEAALKSAGASCSNVVQFTTYHVHSQDIPKFMSFRLREFLKIAQNVDPLRSRRDVIQAFEKCPCRRLTALGTFADRC
jgi:enamine deaminase RidA (YjgF/YER057c/UK114 family)